MVKSFKRVIAVALSVLMVATTLPFTAISATAAEDDISKHLVGEYLTTGIDEAFTNVNGVTWDNVNGAYFAGSDNYLYTSSTDLFKDVTADGGFTVSFLGYSSSNNASTGRYFEFNEVGGTKGSLQWADSTGVTYVTMYWLDKLCY
jgi:hypothetical protein